MAGVGRVERSASTWRQQARAASGAGAAVLDAVAVRVERLGRSRVLVGIDGRTAAGKTTLADQLADRLAGRGRVVLRASLDDFKRPWRDAHLDDRVSGEGYYRNAFNLEAVVRLLLAPARRDGASQVALCSIDPLTQQDHSQQLVPVPDDAVLVVDGVFAFRPELISYWDLRLWVEVDAETSLHRGVGRDADMVGAHDADAVHRDRYQLAEAIYIDEVQPARRADAVIDNTNLGRPNLTWL